MSEKLDFEKPELIIYRPCFSCGRTFPTITSQKLLSTLKMDCSCWKCKFKETIEKQRGLLSLVEESPFGNISIVEYKEK